MSYTESNLGLHCLHTYKLMMFFVLFCFVFSYFSKKMGSDISCKMSPDETDSMKCQTLFSAKC